MQKSSLMRIYEFIRRDTSLAISLGYLLLIGIGMTFNYFHYDRWGINVFEYAGFSDFLIAPFRDFVVFVFVIFSVLFTGGIYVAGQWLDARFPRMASFWNLGLKPGSNAYRIFYQLLLFAGPLFYIFYFAIVFSDMRYRKTKNSPDKFRIEVYVNNDWKEFIKIGQTENYLMTFDETRHQVVVFRLGDGVSALRFSAEVPR